MTSTVLRFRYRAYPDGKQTRALSRLFGCCRVVANDFITARHAAYHAGLPMPPKTELDRTLITLAKQTPGRVFLAEVSPVPLQQALADVDRAYRNFFDSLKGKRVGRKIGPPRFQSRHDSRQSARFTANARFKITRTGGCEAVLRLPKIGDIRFVLSRPLPSQPTSVTVIRESDGRTYLSFVVAVVETPAPVAGRAAGIDMGLSSFATVLTQDTSTGEETSTKVETPAFLRRKARALARSQRSLVRKKKGSANRTKAIHRVAVLHRKVRETRLDHAHQHAARIVAAHDVIAVEDLSVAGMARTNLAAAVHDQSMAQFLRLLSEKATRQGKTVVTVGRFYPSTQLCSFCHQATGPKGRGQLGVRHWTCAECGVTHDRDVNAARNILTEGLRLLTTGPTSIERPLVADGRSETRNACGAQVRRPAMAAPGVEAGSPAGDQQPCLV